MVAGGFDLTGTKMTALRARMKAGCRPVVLGSSMTLVPEYPHYWAVPVAESSAVELLVRDGQVEYEPKYARGAGGEFAVAPALEPVVARPAPPAKAFQRNRRG